LTRVDLTKHLLAASTGHIIHREETTMRTMGEALANTTMASPLGDLTILSRAGVMIGLYFSNHWYRPDPWSFGAESEVGFDDVRRELGEYFAGQRREFDIPLSADGDEQQWRVWNLVRQVPYGETSTYGRLAQELGDGTTAQEVGAAVGRNPLCILIPCHRIVGSTRKLVGYAGGLRRKQLLLDLEKDTVDRPNRLF
jgi:methylated-DNA-[protein]-cysteine S-methyltransferase